MPYNTRRKSLSLPSLGIHVPVTHAARAAANRANSHSPSHPSYNKSHGASSSMSSIPSPLAISTSASPATSTMDAQTHPKKKIKRSHSSDDAAHAAAPCAKRHQSDANTPPPSPRDRSNSVDMKDDTDDNLVPIKMDLEGINDEIVEAVVIQLQNTANRPHLVKELAAILMQQLRIVQQ